MAKDTRKTMFSLLTSRFKAEDNTGFGTQAQYQAGRYYKDGGIPNVTKTGLPWQQRYSIYHLLMDIGTLPFFLLVFVVFVVLNLLFTAGYLLIGTHQLMGLQDQGGLAHFVDVFAFSVQTFTSVGYGRVSPMGVGANLLSSVQAFTGLLAFALASGLFYARFSRPRTFLKFSKNAVLAPFEDGMALMFRMAAYKNNLLSDVEVRLTLATKEQVDGKTVNKFYILPTRITKINMLVLSWTVVHPLDADSPLAGITQAALEQGPFELIIFVRAFDETYSNQVVARTSYLHNEVRWNTRFKVMYYPSPDQRATVLDFSLLDDMEAL
jgi:inward rectifier potassium channel